MRGTQFESLLLHGSWKNKVASLNLNFFKENGCAFYYISSCVDEVKNIPTNIFSVSFFPENRKYSNGRLREETFTSIKVWVWLKDICKVL